VVLAVFLAAAFFAGRGGEVEADFAVLEVAGEVGVELALGAVGDEAFEDVGLPGADELEDLVLRDFALENGLGGVKQAH